MKKDLFTCRRVVGNLIQQDCYVRDCSLCRDIDTSVFPAKYISLDEKVTPTGVVQEFNEYDYPITSEYVNSFVESCDYRIDPLQAMSKSAPGVNLGDISDIQNVANMDMEQARKIYEELAACFSNSVSTSDKKKIDKEESEVKE